MTGNDRRMREAAMRQGGACPRTRDPRERYLPTDPGTAALRRNLAVTREYQRDSSSKRPANCRLQSLLPDTHPPWEPNRFDKRSFYISSPWVEVQMVTRQGLRVRMQDVRKESMPWHR